MASKIKGFCSFSNGVLNGSKHWYLGATEHKGIDSLTGESHPAHVPVLWYPDAIKKGTGRCVLFSNYLKFSEGTAPKEWYIRAQEIELETNLKEMNPSLFYCSK